MSFCSTRIIAFLLAASVVPGMAVCPCFAAGGEALPARQAKPAEAPKCPHCRKPAPENKAPDRGPTQRCPHCDTTLASDRASGGAGQHSAIDMAIGHTVPLAHSVAMDTAVDLPTWRDSVPIPPLLTDLFHSACQLTV